MITVFRGNENIICTKNTYEEQLKHLGYQIASEKKEAKETLASFDKKEEKNEDVEYEKISEKYKLDNKAGKKKK